MQIFKPAGLQWKNDRFGSLQWSWSSRTAVCQHEEWGLAPGPQKVGNGQWLKIHLVIKYLWDCCIWFLLYELQIDRWSQICITPSLWLQSNAASIDDHNELVGTRVGGWGYSVTNKYHLDRVLSSQCWEIQMQFPSLMNCCSPLGKMISALPNYLDFILNKIKFTLTFEVWGCPLLIFPPW